MTARTTAYLSTEVLEDTLLTLNQLTTRLTVLALNASRNPEQSPQGFGSFWETCWQTFTIVRSNWGLMPLWMPD